SASSPSTPNPPDRPGQDSSGAPDRDPTKTGTPAPDGQGRQLSTSPKGDQPSTHDFPHPASRPPSCGAGRSGTSPRQGAGPSGGGPGGGGGGGSDSPGTSTACGPGGRRPGPRSSRGSAGTPARPARTPPARWAASAPDR